MNCVIITGRLTRDVDYRQNGESSLAKFTIAVDRRFKRDNEQGADFIPCIAFGKTSDFIAKYFTKGMKIGITGRIQTGSYTNREGQKVYTTDVVVENAEFVETKNTQNNENQNVQQDTSSNDDDGFMNIPDEINEELPFT